MQNRKRSFKNPLRSLCPLREPALPAIVADAAMPTFELKSQNFL
jgi:hypothetical protein